jgi:hypothetical protein
LKEFHKSYTLKNQECEEKKLNKFYQDRDSEEFQVLRTQLATLTIAG